MVNLTAYMVATTAMIVGIDALDHSSFQKVKEALQESKVLPPTANPTTVQDIEDINNLLSNLLYPIFPKDAQGRANDFVPDSSLAKVGDPEIDSRSSIYNKIRDRNMKHVKSASSIPISIPVATDIALAPKKISAAGLTDIIGDVENLVGKAAGDVSNEGADPLGSTTGLANDVVDSTTDAADDVTEGAKDIVDGIADAAGNVVDGITGGALGGLTDGAKDLVHDVTGTGEDIIEGATDAIDGAVGGTVNTVHSQVFGGDPLTGILGGVGDLVGGILGGLADIMDLPDVVGDIANEATGALGNAAGLASGLTGAVGDVANEVAGAMGDVVDKAAGAVGGASGLPSDLTDAFGDAAEKVTGAVDDAAKKATDADGNVSNKVTGAAGDVANKAAGALPADDLGTGSVTRLAGNLDGDDDFGVGLLDGLAGIVDGVTDVLGGLVDGLTGINGDDVDKESKGGSNAVSGATNAIGSPSVSHRVTPSAKGSIAFDPSSNYVKPLLKARAIRSIHSAVKASSAKLAPTPIVHAAAREMTEEKHLASLRNNLHK